MKEMVFLLEEPSARETIEIVLKRLAGNKQPNTRFIVFEGKQDLKKQLFRKLRGYNNPYATFFIVCDQDNDSCTILKNSLLQQCQSSGKTNIIVRIVCRELESWYLADWNALEKAFPGRKLQHLSKKNKYRHPDSFQSPAQELKKIIPEYQKINGSRTIAPFLNLDQPGSPSFYHFISSLKKQLLDK